MPRSGGPRSASVRFAPGPVVRSTARFLYRRSLDEQRRPTGAPIRRSEYEGQVRPVQAYVAVLSVQSNLSRRAVYFFLRSGEKIPIVAIKRVQVILAP